jgi:hypothetical protein
MLYLEQAQEIYVRNTVLMKIYPSTARLDRSLNIDIIFSFILNSTGKDIKLE